MPTDTTAPDAALSASWFGAGLSPATRARIAALARSASVEPGTVLLHEGGPVTDLGIVVRGRVALRLRIPERGSVTVSTVDPGDVIGWSALVAPHRSTSTAIAVAPTDLVLVDGAALRRELAADAELAAAVYPVLLEAVARRLVGTRLQLLDLFAREVAPW